MAGATKLTYLLKIYIELTFEHHPPLYVLLASGSSCPVWERKIWALEKGQRLIGPHASTRIKEKNP
jgi:hypothetical protein